MKKYRLFVALALICSILAVPIFANAQQSSSGQGLEISPPLKEFSANPGQVVKTEVKLRNVTTQTLVTSSQLNDFVADGESGQPKLLLDNTEQSPYSIKSWLGTIPSVTLKPKEQKSIPITISVPADASPGGHYGVVRFTGLPPGVESTGVSLSASIGTLFLVKVSGNIVEQANISNMFTSQSGKQRWLFETGPVNITEKIQNTGNVHFKPRGTVQVKNMFGRETALFQLNENGGNVLPSSTRRFDQTLNKKFLFGRYTAAADVVYGSNNKIISRTISFWVIPYKLILIVLLAIVLIIFLIRRYNKHIIKKAQKGNSKNGKNATSKKEKG